MRTLIASPFLEDYLVLRPDDQRAVKIGAGRYRDLLDAAPTIGPAHRTWPPLWPR